jgi:splicing factor 3B subunit 1
VVETTVELANKVGASQIISRIVEELKDEKEDYRRMVMETIEKIIQNLGAADIDTRLEEQLLDGILFAFQVGDRLIMSMILLILISIIMVILSV